MAVPSAFDPPEVTFAQILTGAETGHGWKVKAEFMRFGITRAWAGPDNGSVAPSGTHAR
jgi:hypothetical protein